MASQTVSSADEDGLALALRSSHILVSPDVLDEQSSQPHTRSMPASPASRPITQPNDEKESPRLVPRISQGFPDVAEERVSQLPSSGSAAAGSDAHQTKPPHEYPKGNLDPVVTSSELPSLHDDQVDEPNRGNAYPTTDHDSTPPTARSLEEVHA